MAKANERMEEEMSKPLVEVTTYGERKGEPTPLRNRPPPSCVAVYNFLVCK